MCVCLMQTVFPYGSDVTAIASAISNLRASVSGGNNDMGLFNGTSTILAPADENAVAYSRSPAQVCESIPFPAYTILTSWCLHCV